MAQTKKIDITKEIDSEAKRLIKGFSDMIFTLSERWEDEKQYEDFSEYKKVITEKLNSLGYDNIIQITKKFKIRVESKLYKNVFLDITPNDSYTIAAKIITFKNEPISPKTKSEEPKPQPVQTKEPQVETFPDDEVDQDELPFNLAINKLQEKQFEKLLKAVEKLNLTVDKPVQLRKTEEILKRLPGNYNYIIIDITENATQFEITNKDFSIVAKSKSCGSWKSIANNSNIFVYEF